MHSSQYPDEFLRNELQVTGGINSQSAWELETGYSVFLSRFFGFTIGLNVMSQDFSYWVDYLLNNRSFDERTVWDDQQYASAVLLRPAVRLSLPLMKEVEKDAWMLNLEAGPLFHLFPNETRYYTELNYPYLDYITVKNKGAKALFHHVKGFLTIPFNKLHFAVGYYFSNFDLYNGQRNMIVDGRAWNESLPKKKNLHSFFVSFGYRF